MNESQVMNGLKESFAKRSFFFPKLPILYKAAPFLELMGPELASRILMVPTTEETAYCLRPEFTLPICLYHMKNNKSTDISNYAYCGPVFRLRNGEASEFIQAGVEFLGNADIVDADVHCLKEALITIDALDTPIRNVITGDIGLFHNLLNELQIPQLMQRRLITAFGNKNHLEKILATTETEFTQNDTAYSSKSIDELLKLGNIRLIGDRSPQEIANRLHEKIEARSALTELKKKILTEYISIETPLSRAPEILTTFANKHKIDFSESLNLFKKRSDLIASRSLPIENMIFKGAFGQKLGYYAGFSFEIYLSQQNTEKRLVSGGRYDPLFVRLDASYSIPAIGFALWTAALTCNGEIRGAKK